jgi:hypothetical protein
MFTITMLLNPCVISVASSRGYDDRASVLYECTSSHMQHVSAPILEWKHAALLIGKKNTTS